MLGGRVGGGGGVRWRRLLVVGGGDWRGGEVKSKHTFRIGFTLLLEAMVTTFVSSSRRNIQEATSNRPEGRLEGGTDELGSKVEGEVGWEQLVWHLTARKGPGLLYLSEVATNKQLGIVAECGCRQCWRRKCRMGFVAESWRSSRGHSGGQRLVGGWWVVPGQDGRKGKAVCVR